MSAQTMLLLEPFTLKVSLAVRLDDDFSPMSRVSGKVVVSLMDRHNQPVKNRSGYYVFLGIAAGDIVVQVRSQWYLDEDRTLSLPLPDPLNPLQAITLMPNWLYPFPQRATLISGRVQDGGGVAVANAQVRLVTLQGRQVGNRTAGDGRFVLYVTGLTENHVQATKQGRVLLTSDGGTSFQLETSHADFQTKSTSIDNVMEGETLFLAQPITLPKT